MKWIVLLALANIAGCTTRYIEYEGACITQQWMLSGFMMRQREICELPKPEDYETSLEDKEAVSPYPDFFDLRNPADTNDGDLLEKKLFDKTQRELEKEEKEKAND